MPLLPVPLPDELISSVIARGARENGLTSKRQIQDAFGDSRSYRSFLFGDSLHRLGILCGKAPEKLLWDHTVFAYATGFLPEQRRHTLAIQAMENTARGKMNFVSARVSKGSTYRKVCPRCIADDLRTFGTSYWRVSHQLPLSSYCIIHQTILECSDIQLHRNANSRDITLPHETQTSTFNIDIEPELAQDLSNRSARIIQRISESNAQIKPFREAALRLGFIRPSGALAARALCTEFQEFFGFPYLNSLGCTVPDSSPWPAFLCSERKLTQASTTKHILLAAFLGSYRRPVDRKLSTYKSRKRARKDFCTLDVQTETRLTDKFGAVPLANAQLNIAYALSQVNAKSLFSHHRDRLPLTAAWVDQMKYRPKRR